MPEVTPVAEAGQARRHRPLEEDLLTTGLLRNTPGKRKSRNEDGSQDKFVGSKASKKILRIGQELADEDRDEQAAAKLNTAFGFEPRISDAVTEDVYEDDEAWGDEEEEIVQEADLAPSDLEIFSKFFPTEDDPLLRQGWGGTVTAETEEQQGTNLAEIILEKIAAHEAAQADTKSTEHGMTGAPEVDYGLHPKVVDVYAKIGLLLSRYKAGKLPKPFKILPTVPRWEEILELTRPSKWTPNACYEATRIFVSSSPAVAQRFIEMVILERVREDIHETKKLNIHLFNALKKGLYKPAAWFKGFLFPLVGSGTCTLREAHIISAVLTRVSIPVLHSAAALKGLCDIAAHESNAGTEGGGATNIFIRVLLEKKYALPYQVIDALVFHFLRFRSVDEGATRIKDTQLPVIWHQSLLVFAQRYRNDITEDQREALLDLLVTRSHFAIGPEVRRELLEGRGRGVPIEPEGARDGGDDTMLVD